MSHGKKGLRVKANERQWNNGKEWTSWKERGINSRVFRTSFYRIKVGKLILIRIKFKNACGKL